MSSYISLIYLHSYIYCTCCHNSANFTSFWISNSFRVSYKSRQPFWFFLPTKVSPYAFCFYRAVHSYFHLVVAWRYRNMHRSICLNKFLTCTWFSDAVEDHLWPARWCHGPVCYFERVVPDKSFCARQAVGTFESKLSMTVFWSWGRLPIITSHKSIFAGETI